MPGRYGTTGIAIAVAGFQPIRDERGKDGPISATPWR